MFRHFARSSWLRKERSMKCLIAAAAAMLVLASQGQAQAAAKVKSHSNTNNNRTSTAINVPAGPFLQDAKGTCHAANGQVVKASLCAPRH
jgi:hypothetical protein